jgi:hypothetical protein
MLNVGAAIERAQYTADECQLYWHGKNASNSRLGVADVHSDLARQRPWG